MTNYETILMTGLAIGISMCAASVFLLGIIKVSSLWR